MLFTVAVAETLGTPFLALPPLTASLLCLDSGAHPRAGVPEEVVKPPNLGDKAWMPYSLFSSFSLFLPPTHTLRDTVSSKESHFLSPCPGLKDLKAQSPPLTGAHPPPPFRCQNLCASLLRVRGVRELTQRQPTSDVVLGVRGLLACLHAEPQCEGSSIWSLMRFHSRRVV